MTSARFLARPTTWLLPVGGLGGVLALWAATWQVGVLPHESIPSPMDTGRAMRTLVADHRFWTQLRQTSVSWAVGLAVAAAIAVPLGVIVGASPTAYRLTRVVIEALRPIPPVVVLPLALLVLGGGLMFEVALIAQGAIWPLFVQTSYGVRTTDPVALDTARSYHLGVGRRMVLVRLPAAATQVASGLRLAAATAFAVCLVAELIGGADGIGASLLMAQTGGDIATVLALTVVAGLYGLAIAAAFGAVERRVLRWAPRAGS